MQVIDRRKALQIPPVWRLSFRPFFLAGSAFAVLAIGLWICALNGLLGSWQPAGGWQAWHRHELLFGFGVAIIAGFLLTAVQNWTGQPGLSGKPLMAMTSLWLAARIGWLINLPLPLLLPLEAAFLFIFAGLMAEQLWRARQASNYPIVAVLLLLAAANCLLLYGLATADDGLQRQAAYAALWLVATLMGLIGGRVIPFFTQRGLRRTEGVKAWVWLDKSLLACGLILAVLFASGLALQANPWLALPFAAFGLGHLVRLVRWHDRGIWQVDLLWSLHLAFSWLVISALGLALWQLGLVYSPSPALHALAIGAMAGLILAMIARVSLGHTGRDLKTPKAMSWAFALLNAGAAARVFLVGYWPQAALWLAALCWISAFALYLYYYAPLLMQARPDGHPG
ncbi:MAG: hypothetical protein ACI9EB_001841 [Pseudomonas sp.]|jgi:uncharacterized protein involved in response to NO